MDVKTNVSSEQKLMVNFLEILNLFLSDKIGLIRKRRIEGETKCSFWLLLFIVMFKMRLHMILNQSFAMNIFLPQNYIVP